MTQTQTNIEKNFRYKYMVLNEKDEWETWTGTFSLKAQALKWYHNHGIFHEERGHKIALFYKGKLQLSIKNFCESTAVYIVENNISHYFNFR